MIPQENETHSIFFSEISARNKHLYGLAREKRTASKIEEKEKLQIKPGLKLKKKKIEYRK